MKSIYELEENLVKDGSLHDPAHIEKFEHQLNVEAPEHDLPDSFECTCPGGKDKCVWNAVEKREEGKAGVL